MRTRTLRLTKETLTRLDDGELASVAGASDIRCAIACNYTYCVDCINDWTFEFCPPPPTLPVEHCL